MVTLPQSKCPTDSSLDPSLSDIVAGNTMLTTGVEQMFDGSICKVVQKSGSLFWPLFAWRLVSVEMIKLQNLSTNPEGTPKDDKSKQTYREVVIGKMEWEEECNEPFISFN